MYFSLLCSDCCYHDRLSIRERTFWFWTIKLFILIVYVWFAIGIAVISVLQFENCLAGSRFQTSIYHKAFRKDREKIMKCMLFVYKLIQKWIRKRKIFFIMETLLRKAMESHPDTQLIIFPELAVTGYQCGKKF